MQVLPALVRVTLEIDLTQVDRGFLWVTIANENLLCRHYLYSALCYIHLLRVYKEIIPILEYCKLKKIFIGTCIKQIKWCLIGRNVTEKITQTNIFHYFYLFGAGGKFGGFGGGDVSGLSEVCCWCVGASMLSLCMMIEWWIACTFIWFEWVFLLQCIFYVPYA